MSEGDVPGGRGSKEPHEAQPTDELPSPDLFAGVVGQPRVVGQLRSAARRPVHAYLFHGPPGTEKRLAARGFAAALLCPRGGCAACNDCRRALAGTHPDLVTVERTGATLDVEEARQITARAQRHPVEAERQVLVVHDVHLAGRAVPALLKTVEEPPASTIFVLVADDLPVDLVTVASRCVRIRFDAVPTAAIAEWLERTGLDPTLAESIASASAGRPDRARLLVDDPGFLARQERWRSVPARLDGTGVTVAAIAVRAVVRSRRRARRRSGRATSGSWPSSRSRPRPAARAAFPVAARSRTGTAARSGAGGPTTCGAGSPPSPPSSATASSPWPATRAALTPGAAAERRRAARRVDVLREASAALDRNVNELLVMDALLVELSGMTD